ncbi:hypothetical protein CYMTET_7911 [Cymbomonas tetramitiformis]|uniref:Polymerase nucleotidyl transferase domain-containing protein n=1 Tax=Cymbomonas tetramitiformis TaxID=36881 RepID=A0AAE0GU30_9CHLO|nr:hypothetical protein CYMTET_7911 [Cymbomonas tetramitiformis]
MLKRLQRALPQLGLWNGHARTNKRSVTPTLHCYQERLWIANANHNYFGYASLASCLDPQGPSSPTSPSIHAEICSPPTSSLSEPGRSSAMYGCTSSATSPSFGMAPIQFPCHHGTQQRGLLCSPFEGAARAVLGWRAMHCARKAGSLHDELVEFARRIEEEVASEQPLQMQCLSAIKRSLVKYGGATDIELYGSRAFGLALPNSDFDIQVQVQRSQTINDKGHECKKKISQLMNKSARILLQHNLAKPGSMMIIRQAKVPIVKFELLGELEGVRCDLSFRAVEPVLPSESEPEDMTSGSGDDCSSAAAWTAQRLAEYPGCLAPLMLFLKGALKQAELGEPAKGGLGGYSLANLLVAHLRNSAPEDHRDLGMLLLSFLHRYGQQFDASSEAVALKEAPTGFVPQKGQPWLARKTKKGYGSVHIQDPTLLSNDLGKATHKWDKVQKHFIDIMTKLNDSEASAEASSGRDQGNDDQGRQGGRQQIDRLKHVMKFNADGLPEISEPPLTGNFKFAPGFRDIGRERIGITEPRPRIVREPGHKTWSKAKRERPPKSERKRPLKPEGKKVPRRA